MKTFREKPNIELAKEFVKSGEFVWNAGIFIWNVKAIIESFQENLPETAKIFSEMQSKYYTNGEKQAIAEAYATCKSVSIDNGIMEKANNVYVVLSDIGWSDLGTWKSLYETLEKDEQENAIDGNVMLYNTHNSIIKTPKDRLVVVNGLDGFIVAEYDNVLMICRKDDEQKVKEFVAHAKGKGEHFV